MQQSQKLIIHHFVNQHRCFSSYDKDQGSKLTQKGREVPCRKANAKRLSVHLIHMCLAAKGFAVGAMTLAKPKP
ncbi:unnamed protein product [Nyctereutes procyonoides]|uniref:(raccoon dog) hypothetical protein n=1 Tax=Nyctereutes procyonoides TaxID=34880 RepID=A0A811Z3I5_NYCPR|nr:unnamed protein product [Nyctereutes procyonoides]